MKGRARKSENQSFSDAVISFLVAFVDLGNGRR